MSTRSSEQPIDLEILSLNGGVLDGILRLGNGGAPVDLEVLSLRGAMFDSLPSEPAPVDADNEAVPLVRVLPRSSQISSIPPPAADLGPMPVGRARTDSLPPSSRSIAPPAPQPAMRTRSGSRIFGLAVAAGLGCILTAGALAGRSPEPRMEAAAQPVAAVADPPSAPAEHPLPIMEAALPAPPPAAQPASAPTAVRAPAPVAAPRSVRAVVPAPEAAPAKVEADLPPVAAPPPPAAPFDRTAAAAAIAQGAKRASSCLDAGVGSMTVPVSVTFAPSGRATVATVTGGPLVGTREGACVAGAVHGVSVPRFEGDAITVTSSIRVR